MTPPATAGAGRLPVRPPTVGGAGGAYAGGDSGQLGRWTVDLWRVECEGEPIGVGVARTGGRGRSAGGLVCGALGGDGGGDTRHPEGGRSVCAARPELPA